jgi:hypothetical protein
VLEDVAEEDHGVWLLGCTNQSEPGSGVEDRRDKLAVLGCETLVLASVGEPRQSRERPGAAGGVIRPTLRSDIVICPTLRSDIRRGSIDL